MTICEQVEADIRARAQLGMERYGKPLMPGDVRAALQNAYEEALDQCIYLKQALLSLDNKGKADSAVNLTEKQENLPGATEMPLGLACGCGRTFTSPGRLEQHHGHCSGLVRDTEWNGNISRIVRNATRPRLI